MLAALRRRHYSTFQAVNRVDGRRKRLSKWVECEIILLNRENSVFQVHVLNWVHPCQAVNNALSLLPSARVTGRLLHNSQCRMGYCSTARGCRSCSAPNEATGWLQPPPAAALLISLAPYGLAAALLPPKAPRNPPGQENGQCGCVRALLLGRTRHWGCLPSFLWLEIDTLAASACTCQCEQTQELFFASHTIEWKALMKLKFYSDHNDTYSQKRIQLQFPNAKLCEVLKCSCLFIFQVFVAFDNCSRKFCARAAIYLIPCPSYYKLEALSNQKSSREGE